MLQTTALNILKSGKNVFLTGQAGAWKTFVLNKYIEYLKQSNIKVAVTASTGIASTHINGTTIHSRCGIGIKDYVSNRDIDELLEKDYLQKNINWTKVLIIDEISMLSWNSLDQIEKIVRAFVSKNDFMSEPKPFGGIQVIVCGDFFQLPPVVKFGWNQEKRFAREWESREWSNFSVCYLQEQYRQDSYEFLKLLNELRIWQVSKSSLELLQSRYNQKPNFDIRPTKLYTHNVDVDMINYEELTKLDEEEHIFEMKNMWDHRLVEVLKKSSIAMPTLRLKKWAVVIFIKNNNNKWYLNGTVGKVIDFSQNNWFPMVQISDGSVIEAIPEDRTLDQNYDVLAKITQIPLKLARAITIHKSQWMSLDCAEIDLSKSFEPGQSYVALSRMRSLEWLNLLWLNTSWLLANPKVVAIDQDFKKESDILEINAQKVSSSDFQVFHRRFVEKCGWIFYGSELENLEIKKELKVSSNIQNKKRKSSTVSKNERLEIAKNLIKDKKSIEEMSALIWVTVGTIFSYLWQIKSKYPEVSISYLKPKWQKFKKIFQTIQKMSKDPKNFTDSWVLKLSQIHKALDWEIDYDDIKMAFLFL